MFRPSQGDEQKTVVSPCTRRDSIIKDFIWSAEIGTLGPWIMHDVEYDCDCENNRINIKVSSGQEEKVKDFIGDWGYKRDDSRFQQGLGTNSFIWTSPETHTVIRIDKV